MRKPSFLPMALLVVLFGLISWYAPGAVLAQTTKAPAPAPQKFKLAAIFPGVITDADYNTLGYVAVTQVKTALGIEIAYSESVPVPDVERVLREYINAGFNIIWTHGGQFISQTAKLAKEFKDAYFIAEADAPLKEMPPNLWVIDRNFHLGFYPIGALAAKQTRTGKIGYIGGLALPFSYSEVHAIRQAIKDLGLNVELKAVWVGDFNDPGKARLLTEAMIAEKMDVIIGSLNLGMLGVFEAAKGAPGKVWVTAKYTDKSGFAPHHYITSVLYDFAGPLRAIVQKIRGGQTGGYYPLGFETGVTLQFPLKNVSAELSNGIKQLVAGLEKGRTRVIKDTTPIK